MATQPQQQSSSEEGSKENTTPQWTKTEQRKECPGPSFRVNRWLTTRTSSCSNPQHRLEDHHRLPQSTIQTETTRIHWNAMTPMDPPKHLQMAKAKELLNQRRHQNLILEIQQIQVLLLSLLTHQRTLLYVLGVVKVGTGAEIVHIIISVIFVEWPPTPPTCVEPTNVEPDYQSVFTVAKLTTVLLIVGTGLGTTRKNLNTHQMH